jgi:VanZ family protein
MRRFSTWLPVVLWSLLILSAANDGLSSVNTGHWLHRIFGVEVPEVMHVMIRKTAHILEYGILGFLTWRAHRSMTIPLLAVLLVSSTDEWLQSRTTARTGTPFDVVLDCCAAFVFVALAMRLSQKKTARQSLG